MFRSKNQAFWAPLGPLIPLFAIAFGSNWNIVFSSESPQPIKDKIMAKPGRKTKKANHGKRPANAKARKAKRKKIKTP